MNAVGQAPVGITVFAGQSLVEAPASSLPMVLGLTASAVRVFEISATLPISLGVYGTGNPVLEVSGSVPMSLLVQGAALTISEVWAILALTFLASLNEAIVYEDGTALILDFAVESSYPNINIPEDVADYSAINISEETVDYSAINIQ